MECPSEVWQEGETHIRVGGSATQEDIAVNIVKGVVREESWEGGKGEAAGVGGGGVDLDLLHRLVSTGDQHYRWFT